MAMWCLCRTSSRVPALQAQRQGVTALSIKSLHLAAGGVRLDLTDDASRLLTRSDRSIGWSIQGKSVMQHVEVGSYEAKTKLPELFGMDNILLLS